MTPGVGFSESHQAGLMDTLFREFFDWCNGMDIPVVLAAGNSNKSPLHEKVPQNRGTPRNSVITVGGVTEHGILYDKTSPAYDGHDGSMTVFAPAVGFTVPGYTESSDEGTSQAAALVVSSSRCDSMLKFIVPSASCPSKSVLH